MLSAQVVVNRKQSLSDSGILKHSAAAALVQDLFFLRFRQFAQPDLLHYAIIVDQEQGGRAANL